MDKLIEVGDFVHININNAQTTITKRAKVLYTPCATGDSWHFENTEDGAIIYISEGFTMTLLSKGES